MGIFGSRRSDERGAETVAMLFVIPVMVVLVLTLIDVGMMFRNRMVVENITRDAVRGAAADGGNFNARTNTTGATWENWARNRLTDNGKCAIGYCKAGKMPTVDCNNMMRPGGGRYQSNVAEQAGDVITCEVHYPYKPINGALLNGPMGLGMGSLLNEFNISVSARSETGTNSAFGSG